MGSSLKCAVLLLFKIKAQKQNIVNIKAIFSILLTIGGMLITVVQDDTHAFSLILYMQLNIQEAKQL
jgi:hypothetical protein